MQLESTLLVDSEIEHCITVAEVPITSCDVERSFSHYKNILTENRHNLNSENIEKIIVL
jgi:hypothetical protein